eukprot:Nitzschia sp. Nitz4//scaffold291_size36643//30362//30643//NITZ4_007770-RA/size36643-snap-gene-0.27-mRNA-1//1//CDS//3329546148//4268//frame0
MIALFAQKQEGETRRTTNTAKVLSLVVVGFASIAVVTSTVELQVEVGGWEHHRPREECKTRESEGARGSST